jgi:putative CocE/NonD family hydrolase
MNENNNHKLFLTVLLNIIIIIGSISGCTGRSGEEEDESGHPRFELVRARIPMRDGVRLYTQIYMYRKTVPKYKNVPLPIILYRTPYNVYSSGNQYRLLDNAFDSLVEEKYVFVFQDIRGRNNSEGQFVMDRLPRDPNDPNAVDETTDAYDTIEWLLNFVPENNGRVGMIGDSYSGWLVLMAMIDPHPALKAVAILGNNADYYVGDDFYHYGAFRLSMGFEFSYMMENPYGFSNFNFESSDLFQWFLDLGPLSNVNALYFNHQIPTWNNFMAHPNYDSFWQAHAALNYINRVSVPALIVAGWWDGVDFYGPMKTYEILEKYDTNNEVYLVVGPWLHGSWWWEAGQYLGPVELGSYTSIYYRENFQAPWFARYLKDFRYLDIPEVTTYRTGSDEWVSHSQWPPKENITEENLYFRQGSELSFEPPQANANDLFVSYVSDPDEPVPYTERPIAPFLQGSFYKWKYEDQRFLQGRSDVVWWETEELEKDIIIQGEIIAEFYASTSGTDCDWVVKLIDVHPDPNPDQADLNGYELMIADEVMRAKFRNSLEVPEPVPANQVVKYQLNLNSRHHCFKKGHKIKVMMHSTWFPLIDRNPQKFVNIPNATEEDFQRATQKIYFSNMYPSHLKLPILDQ